MAVAYWCMEGRCLGCRGNCHSNIGWRGVLFGRKRVGGVVCIGRVRGVWFIVEWR